MTSPQDPLAGPPPTGPPPAGAPAGAPPSDPYQVPRPGPPPIAAPQTDPFRGPAAGQPTEPFQAPAPTGPPLMAPPPQGHPTGPARVRPWWGMGDALMAIPITLGAFVVGLVIIVVLAFVEDVDVDAVLDGDSAALPASMLVLPTLVQQGAWTVWPFLVSRWKGLGPAEDWGWSFKPVDLAIGFGTAMIAMTTAGIAGAVAGALVGLEDEALAENTSIITDLEGSPWLWGILFVVVIGAPVSEELLFRGLILRAVAKRWGTVIGVIGSLIVFVPIHFADGGITSAGQIVLWVSIATLGAVLAVAAVMTKRLGAPIVAHIIINATASAGALGLFDRVTDQF